MPEPKPTEEDRRRARLLAGGMGGDDSIVDLLARGIAVGRAGGDVEAFMRQQLQGNRP